MAALLGVRPRSAPVLLQEHQQPALGALEVVLRIHRGEDLVFAHAGVELGGQPVEGRAAADGVVEAGGLTGRGRGPRGRTGGARRGVAGAHLLHRGGRALLHHRLDLGGPLRQARHTGRALGDARPQHRQGGAQARGVVRQRRRAGGQGLGADRLDGDRGRERVRDEAQPVRLGVEGLGPLPVGLVLQRDLGPQRDRDEPPGAVAVHLELALDPARHPRDHDPGGRRDMEVREHVALGERAEQEGLRVPLRVVAAEGAGGRGLDLADGGVLDHHGAVVVADAGGARAAVARPLGAQGEGVLHGFQPSQPAPRRRRGRCWRASSVECPPAPARFRPRRGPDARAPSRARARPGRGPSRPGPRRGRGTAPRGCRPAARTGRWRGRRSPG